MASITLEARQSLVALYVGMFQAAPGATTLGTMVQSYESGKTLKEIAKDLDTATFRGEYPAFLTADEFASRLVSRLLGSDVGEAQTTWATNWVKNKLTSGVADTDVIVEAVNALRATANTAYDTAKSTLTNKITVAEYYSVEKALSSDSLATLQSVISTVTSDSATVDSAKATVDSDAATATASTFTLTTALDTVSGTAGNDTISGILSDSTSDQTWNVADVISAGAGTDTMNVSIVNDGTGGITSSGRSTSGVEIFNVRHVDADTGADTATLDTSGFSGATQIWAKDGTVSSTTDDTLKFTGIASGVTFGVANNDSDLDVTFTSASNLGSGDSATLAVGGGSTGDVLLEDAASDGFATVAITTSGSATTLSSFNGGTDNATINVSGDQALWIIGELQTSVNTFNASENSGKITVTAQTSSSKTYTGGSGTTDVITLNAPASVATGMSVTGFETVGLYASSAATVDMDLISGYTTFNVTSGGANNTLLTLDDVAAAPTINIVGGGLNAAYTFNDLTITLADATGTTDAVTVNINNAGTATGATNDADLGDLTINAVETITLNFADHDDAGLDNVTFNEADTLNVTGSVDVTFGGTNDFTELDVLNAGEMTGDFNIGTLTNATTALTATFGSGADTVTNGTATATQTFNMGAGNDTVTLGEVTNASITFNLGDGDDTMTASAADDAGDTVNIDAGAGTDTFISAGNVDVDSFKGFEKIRITGTNTIDLTVATSYADTVEVLELSGGAADLQFNVAAGGTLSLANFTFLGWTTGNDVLDIIGSTGGETLTGSSVGDTFDPQGGVDTINLGSSGGADSITHTVASTSHIIVYDFDWGATGAQVDSLTLTSSGAIADAAGNAGAVSTGIDGGSVSVAALAVDTAIGAAATNELFVIATGADNVQVSLTATASTIASAIATQLEDGTSVAGNLAAGEGFFGLIPNDANSDNTVDSYILFQYLEQGTAGQAEAGDITVVGVFNGTDAANAHDDNFA